MKWLVRASTIANFLSSGVCALNSGVMWVSGRSLKSCENGVGLVVEEFSSVPARFWARISMIFNIAKKASSNP